jgi:hypothetical protein
LTQFPSSSSIRKTLPGLRSIEYISKGIPYCGDKWIGPSDLF